jgi:hypothetical protein
MKHNEQSIEKQTQMRSTLAKQRFQENKAALSKKRLRKIDIDRCPLLSKPSDSYKRKMKVGANFSSDNNINRRDQPVLNLEDSASPASGASQLENSSANFGHSENNFAQNNNKTVKNKSSMHSENVKKEKPLLRNIYKFDSKSSTRYEHLYLEEHIADLFIALTISKSSKFMNHHEFQTFAKYAL